MNEMTISFAVVPAMRAFVWAFLLLGVLPVILTGGAAWFFTKTISPAVIAVVTILGGIMFSASLAVLLRNDISLTDQSLNVKAGFYKHSVDRSSILWRDVRMISITTAAEFIPRVRTNGIGLPGYQAGWFILQNGTRAFLLVTGDARLYLPTTEGDAVMLSVDTRSRLFQTLVREYGIRPD